MSATYEYSNEKLIIDLRTVRLPISSIFVEIKVLKGFKLGWHHRQTCADYTKDWIDYTRPTRQQNIPRMPKMQKDIVDICSRLPFSFLSWMIEFIYMVLFETCTFFDLYCVLPSFANCIGTKDQFYDCTYFCPVNYVI